MKLIFLKCIFVSKSACRLLFFPLVFHTAFEIIYEHATHNNKNCQRQYDSKRESMIINDTIQQHLNECYVM